MNPSDANSALATLRQLKEMLDAGTLTPQEFEALKQKLVFGQEATAPTTTPISVSLGQPNAVAESETEAKIIPAKVDLPPASATPESTDWLAAAAPVLVDNTPANPLIEAPEERRNPLTLVFIIGGVLVLLALVLYLTLGGNAPDEHLTSTSQTAADSTATAPETGPQAEQLTLPPAVPETIRVAPTVVQAPLNKPVIKANLDSVATSAATVPAAKPAVPAPVKAVAPASTAPVTPAAKADTAKTSQ